jgi:hypothetical protein
MLTSLNWTILHVTDVIVVGRVGEHEVAAAMPSISPSTIPSRNAWPVAGKSPAPSARDARTSCATGWCWG